MKVSFKLLDTVKTLTDKINNYAKQLFKEKFTPRIPQIETEIRAIIKKQLYLSDTVFSILFGTLKLDFGLTDDMAKQVIFDLVEKVANTATIRYNDRAKTIFTLDLLISPPSVDQMLQIRNATYISINAAGEASDVPWLRWLLLEGSQVVVEGYDVKYGDYRRLGYSRTKQAIMLKSNSGFRVDPEHAGTASDNFITRALAESFDDVIAVVSRRVFQT